MPEYYVNNVLQQITEASPTQHIQICTDIIYMWIILLADSYNTIFILMFQNEPRQMLEINAWLRLVCIHFILIHSWT